MEYDSAFTVVPGRVHVDALRLRFEDFNVQFELRVGHAQLDVSLPELVLRRFHVLGVRATRVAFRMRHKLHGVGQDAMRVASYPSIEGFTDPPLYRGVKPEPIPDSQYRLWQVHIENVVADVDELWALEYRFKGRATASGSFLLKPARWVSVRSASLTINSGSLQSGRARPTGIINGRFRCEVPGLDVRRFTGAQVFRAIFAEAIVSIADWDLNFVEQYLEPRFKMTLGGPMRASVHVELAGGHISERSDVLLESEKFSLKAPHWAVEEGRLLVSARSQHGAPALSIRVSGAKLSASVPRIALLHIEQLDIGASVTGLDVTQAISLHVDSVSLDAQSDYRACVRAVGGKPVSSKAIALRCAYSQSGSVTEGQGSCLVKMPAAAPVGHSPPVSLTVQARFHTPKAPQRYVQGALSIEAAGAAEMLHDTGARMLASIPQMLFPDRLETTVAFYLSRSRQLFEVTHARSGVLGAKGFLLRLNQKRPRGALLLSSGALSLGITLEGDDFRLTPLASDGWLRERGREFDLRPN